MTTSADIDRDDRFYGTDNSACKLVHHGIHGTGLHWTPETRQWLEALIEDQTNHAAPPVDRFRDTDPLIDLDGIAEWAHTGSRSLAAAVMDLAEAVRNARDFIALSGSAEEATDQLGSALATYPYRMATAYAETSFAERMADR